PTAVDPFVEPAAQSPGQKIRECEQPTLTRIEHVEVFDSVVRLPIFQLGQSVRLVPLQEDPHERMEEVQMLWRRLQRERVDAHALLPKPDFQVSAVKEVGNLAIAAAEIEDHR